jgi:peptide/nickel transport system substrate-binding protein
MRKAESREEELRELIAQVKARALSRRAFIGKMVLLGLTVPMAGQMLNASGVLSGQPKSDYKPTRRGGGGSLKTLLWQGPTLLNPHFAVGQKDQIGSRVFYEPLAAWDPEGNLIPILAAEIPSLENAGLAADGRSVVWKLKQGVQWHDGEPFTADDCVFNWEYARNPETAAVTIARYQDITVEKIDSHTIKITFPQPKPFWASVFVSDAGMQIPKHLFKDYSGSKSREAPTNLKPVGTGPYTFVEFVPGDIVRGEINLNYYVENRPHFDSIELKGGGDAVSAARAVLQTGEFDYAWNIQVEDEILRRLENTGKGYVVSVLGANIEHIELNFADPWTEVDGERANLKTQHPILSDGNVREALNLLVDRGSVEKFIYGRGGVATANYLTAPERFRSRTTTWEFSIERANQVLDAAGWVRGSDGIRAKDGKKLKFIFQTSINAPRQKTQAIIKQACQKAGIELELKSVVASVFFSSDSANPDTFMHFYTDLEMFTETADPDPQTLMELFISWEIVTKANKWQGRNRCRWRREEYDRMYRQAESELDPVKRAALFIGMNDLLIKERAVIPVLQRSDVAAFNTKIRATLSPWEGPFWLLYDWYRELIA